MPELPEVETIRLGLQKYLVGHKIEKVEVRLPKIVTGDVKNIIGAKFTKVERFGKGLVIHLDNGYVLAVHIKLTGQLIYKGPKEPKGIEETHKNSEEFSGQAKVKIIRNVYNTLPSKHTHVIFYLDKGAVLYYNDFRRFGWIKIMREDEVVKLPFFKELGPEPPVVEYSSSERSESRSSRQARTILTMDKFKEILSKSSSPVKVVIMDQKKIGGVGNIYANDALNLARIDPRRSAKKISADEAKKLYEALITVLKRGLKYGGASELSYVNVLGQEGGYQDHFLTYGRKGEKCFNCGDIIEKITLGGRGTYFCKKCQK